MVEVYGNCTIIVKDPGAIPGVTNAPSTNKPGSTNSSGNQGGSSGSQYPGTNPGNPSGEQAICKVTFILDGTVIMTKEVENGRILGDVPERPNRVGSTFAGWFSMDRLITASQVITDNLTVTGKWDEYTFEEQLIKNDQDSPNRVLVAYRNGEKTGVNGIERNL